MGHLIEFANVKSLTLFAPYFNTYFSITGFFIISGFLITGSYLRTDTLKKYFEKRAARLLPAYLVVVLGSTILFSTISSLNFQNYFTSPQLYKYLVANLSFLNFIQPCLPGVFGNQACPVNGALWTLKVEISFYVTVPIIIYLINKTDKIFFLLTLIYILSLVYSHYMNHLSTVKNNDFYSMLARQLPGAMMYFLSGMIMFYYFQYFNKHKLVLFIAGLIVLVVERYLSVRFLTPFAFACVIFYIAYGFKFLNRFGKYGDISYGIYIFHCPIIKTFVHFDFFKSVPPFLAVAIVILVVITVGFLSWHLLEKKFLNRVHASPTSPILISLRNDEN